eukprot:evm.model.scf_413.3 EVM.evm.TU.scf_413.3   scf_413:22302-25045(+)
MLGFSVPRANILQVVRDMGPGEDGDIHYDGFQSIMGKAITNTTGEAGESDLMPKGSALPFAEVARAFRRRKLLDDLMEGGEGRKKIVEMIDELEDEKPKRATFDPSTEAPGGADKNRRQAFQIAVLKHTLRACMSIRPTPAPSSQLSVRNAPPPSEPPRLDAVEQERPSDTRTNTDIPISGTSYRGRPRAVLPSLDELRTIAGAAHGAFDDCSETGNDAPHPGASSQGVPGAKVRRPSRGEAGAGSAKGGRRAVVGGMGRLREERPREEPGKLGCVGSGGRGGEDLGGAAFVQEALEIVKALIRELDREER